MMKPQWYLMLSLQMNLGHEFQDHRCLHVYWKAQIPLMKMRLSFLSHYHHSWVASDYSYHHCYLYY